AQVGDFGAVGSTHVRLIDDLPNEVAATVGTQRNQELYGGGTIHFTEATRLWGAVSASHFDGPWSPAEGVKKFVAAARLSHGVMAGGYSVTAMYYKSPGLLLTAQPSRAVDQSLIDRFGTLDATDKSKSERMSLSGHYGLGGDRWEVA